MEHVDVLVVGAGLSGIGVGCHLRSKQPHKSFAILEGRQRLGGTWDLFRYPGVRSDSDMFTFGYTFRPWKAARDIAPGEEILRYLEETVEEYRLGPMIRFGHRATHAGWSSDEKRWVVSVERDDGELFQIACDFLVTCTGYYNYEQGYVPPFEGLEDFEGVVAHPQHWPESLDYAGKRVVVIGSGATAITLVPAMAEEAAHVTMLQRSPTYIFSRPAIDPIATFLTRALPEKAAYRLNRLKNIALQWFLYVNARKRPQQVRRYLRDMAAEAVGGAVDVDVHFNPRYEPWDQRMCLIPDDDLYLALRDGKASVVTDTISRFTPRGIRLESGEELEADIVVPATGLQIQFLGGMTMDLDGRELSSPELVAYKGAMFSGVPNWMAMFGYTAASWTLKSDLAADYLCRLLAYMDREGYATVVPQPDDEVMSTRPLMANLESASYVQRSLDQLPRQGDRAPWRNADNYFGDYLSMKLGRLDDGTLRFGR